jgi:hypothetical protein
MSRQSPPDQGFRVEKPEENLSVLGFDLTFGPNPYRDMLKVTALSDKDEPVQLKLINVQGMTVYQAEVRSNELHRISIPLPSGLYILQASNGEDSVEKKVVKTK